jgi:2-polyprenyl-3-methyl-5-hydroxy-6-metoxy-1,4-benzoquinol methylase
MNTESIDNLLENVIDQYQSKPIDLLNINDGEGEYRYLLNARLSYQRTLKDLTELPGRNPADTRVLEIGSYLGPVSIVLARLGYNVTAADLPDFIKNTRLQERYAQNGVSSISLNLEDYEIPAASDSFEVVIICETLEHLNFNPLPVLTEINRVLVHGGHLYISLPNLTSLVNRAKLLVGRSIHDPISDFAAQLNRQNNMIVGIHWREYTKQELTELLNRAGFRVDRHYFFTSTKSHPLARLIFNLYPPLRANQTAIAIKEQAAPTSEYSCRQLYSENA